MINFLILIDFCFRPVRSWSLSIRWCEKYIWCVMFRLISYYQL